MLMNEILKQTLFKKRIALILNKKVLYKTLTDRVDIQEYQVSRFNEIWSNAYKNIPFYKNWKDKYELPDVIENISDIKNFPVLTKKDIQDNYELIISHLPRCKTVSTGGSTGKPVNFPTSKKESDLTYANQYLARSWWHIAPLDSILLFWGHSHLFGNGIKGKINKYKRFIFDQIIGTHRLSAYDMSEEKLKNLHKEVYSSNPTMILGYTSSISKIAKYMDENNLSMGVKSNLKGVVVTSESVSEYDVKIIEKIFNVPCIIEYGMAETGAIAYSKNKTSEIKLLWDSFIAQKDEAGSLYLTTIFEKLFPLINYQTNDIIESENEDSILTINKIVGRKNDFIEIVNNNRFVEVHSELFTHVLKAIPGITNFQVVQKANKKIIIKYISRTNVNIKNNFFCEMEKEYPLDAPQDASESSPGRLGSLLECFSNQKKILKAPWSSP